MIYYIYDGTFAGLLTVIYEAYYRQDEPDKIVKKSDYQEGLFTEKVEITTEQEKSDRVYEAIRNKISGKSLRRVYYAFLSELSGIEISIYHYLKLGFKMGKGVDSHLTDDRVLNLKKISKKVGREKHRMLGLLRFHRLSGGLFYAAFEPDYNILTLIPPQFVKRLSDQNWVIHDCGRDLAVLYNQEEWVITDVENIPELDYAGDEGYYQSLWQEFFDSIAISSRRNSRLQRQFMPRRHWKYLVEKS